jgi:hypothetical protein
VNLAVDFLKCHGSFGFGYMTTNLAMDVLLFHFTSVASFAAGASMIREKRTVLDLKPNCAPRCGESLAHE